MLDVALKRHTGYIPFSYPQLEIPVLATFIVTVKLKKEGDEHWIVPAVQITAEIGDLQISNAFMQLFLQDQVFIY